MRKNITTSLAAMGAVVVLVLGVKAASDNDTGAANASAGGPAAMQQGQMPPQGGQMPPGMGTEATGDEADDAAAAATAEYDGDVEKVMKLEDGSYVVHVVTSSGEVHVAVSADFEVTGEAQGPPGGMPGPPPSASGTSSAT
jgi:hypothetical protein